MCVLSKATALREAIDSAGAVPELRSVDALEDTSAGRVEYVQPTLDPTETVNEEALITILGGYLATVRHPEVGGAFERLQVVAVAPDESDATPLTWSVTREQARRFLAGVWGEDEFLKAVAETSEQLDASPLEDDVDDPAPDL